MVEFKESKFYKLLQDFFINNNKETFLQMLAEFYNRTEGIIEKNVNQDELIKELRELYIEFNEKGIDENIVIEKVNHFVENNVKIKDILAKLVINTNKIEDNTEKLNINTNKIEDNTEKLNINTNKIKNITLQLDSITNKLNVHVDDFGAIGDGINDDTTAFQNALNTVADNGGGIVTYSGYKTYVISNITVPKLVVLKCDSVYVDYVNTYNDVKSKLIRKVGSAGICINSFGSLVNVLLDCNGVVGNGIVLSSNEESKNIFCFNSGGNGIQILKKCRIDGIYSMRNKKDGVIINGSDSFIRNYLIADNEGNGIVIENGGSHFLSNGTVEWNLKRNFYINGTINCNISNTFIDASGLEFLYVKNSNNLSFNNCTIRRSTRNTLGSHIFIDGNSISLYINGCNFSDGLEDGGERFFGCKYIINSNTNGLSSLICIMNSNLNGGYTESVQAPTFGTDKFFISNCILKDIDWRGLTIEGALLKLNSVTSTSLAPNVGNNIPMYDWNLKKLVIKSGGRYYDAMGNELYV